MATKITRPDAAKCILCYRAWARGFSNLCLAGPKLPLDHMEAFWNERYRGTEYAYGTAPNTWLEDMLHKLPPGRLLLPADGEGRNAVYAATLGWDVEACDLSIEGQRKAFQLAAARGVRIGYQVGDFGNLPYARESFDAAGLIYAHFDPAKRPAYHRLLDDYLKPGGHLILEGFSKRHPEWQARHPHIGGPRDIPLLYDLAEIERDFGHYEILYLQEEAVELTEGELHVGEGCVIRFFARKREVVA